MPQLYDEIGVDYGSYRQPDVRIAETIRRALGDAETVVNVGAGTGSYEPTDRFVVAVEPSMTMIRQRGEGSARVIQASATALPFQDASFDAALAVLTIHHWPDRPRGLAELLRVARRLAILTFDPGSRGFWLIEDYFPEIAEFDRRALPPIAEFRQLLGKQTEVLPVPVPHDCTDGFLGAYWRRPEAYLDAGVRSAISAFALLDDVEPGLARLRSDLEDGRWAARHGHLSSKTELDLGYRLVIADRARH